MYQRYETISEKTGEKQGLVKKYTSQREVRKDILPHFPKWEDFSSPGKNISRIQKRRDQYLLALTLKGRLFFPLPFKGRSVFPSSRMRSGEYSSPLSFIGRSVFPSSP